MVRRVEIFPFASVGTVASIAPGRDSLSVRAESPITAGSAEDRLLRFSAWWGEGRTAVNCLGLFVRKSDKEANVKAPGTCEATLRSNGLVQPLCEFYGMQSFVRNASSYA